MRVLQFPRRLPSALPPNRSDKQERPDRLLAAIRTILENCGAEQGRLRDEGTRLRVAVDRLRRQARQASLTQARLARDIARLRRCADRPALPPTGD